MILKYIETGESRSIEFTMSSKIWSITFPLDTIFKLIHAVPITVSIL